MKFLEYFPNSVIQTFPDKKDCKSYAQVFFKYNEPELKKLNELGNGVYFSPNGFKEARKKANLTNLNAVYADLDLAKEGQNVEDLNFKKQNLFKELLSLFPPNFIIETKNGVQPIWLIKADKSEVELHTKVIKGIIEWSKQFGCAGDAVHDCTRVLRLPNYNHMKGEPYLCRAKKFTDEVRTLKELKQIFPYVEPEVINTPKSGELDSPLIQAVNAIDFETLIVSAFGYAGRIAEFDKQGRLTLDGRLTGTFKGKTGGDFLASSSHEPFKGNRITAVADILGATNKEAFKWIKETFNLNVTEFHEKQKAKETVEKLANTTPEKVEKKKPFTWGTPILDSSLWALKRYQYMVLAADTGIGKSEYALFLAKQNCLEGHKVLYVNLEMNEASFLKRGAFKYAGITIREDRLEEWGDNKQNKIDEYINSYKKLTKLKIATIPRGLSRTPEVIFELIQQNSPDIVIIDNLDKVEKPKGVSKFEGTEDISDKFMAFAHDEHIPIILLHHFNKKSGGEHGVNSLRGSGKIGHDSDLIVILDRDTQAEPNSVEASRLDIKVLKHRNTGEFRTAELFFQEGTFSDNFDMSLVNKRHDDAVFEYLQNNII
jgi:replicative DNA helicase